MKLVGKKDKKSISPVTPSVPRQKKESLTETEMILLTSMSDAYKKQYRTKSTLRYETTVALEEKLIRMKVLNPKETN